MAEFKSFALENWKVWLFCLVIVVCFITLRFTTQIWADLSWRGTQTHTSLLTNFTSLSSSNLTSPPSIPFSMVLPLPRHHHDGAAHPRHLPASICLPYHPNVCVDALLYVGGGVRCVWRLRGGPWELVCFFSVLVCMVECTFVKED